MGEPEPVVVKVCGVRTVEAAQAAADAGADIIGMIFAPSPRLIDVATAQAIARAVRPTSGDAAWDGAEGVDGGLAGPAFFAACGARLRAMGRPLLAGVFQNQPLEHILEVARAVPLDLVQLHGTEPVAMAQQIPVPVIKVFHVDEAFSVDEAAAGGGDMLAAFHHSAILLDTKVAGTAQQGGRGVAFDWTVARRLADRGVPFLMAGGLTPDNVAEAIAVGRPWGVDVSSGVETDKAKDSNKIRAFVANARRAGSAT
ncbi:anthranilate synthase / indole-3-glycerol phosphate synthase [Coemansia nantahalensis]|uniref:Anthranilate synthase / indole-3-glycerol phosphate synthase n=2 Tax=Coemansia TaxID=4863 RepID=A0ACC1KTK7_9FUNG|nr:anthranilate synthase / indole-3-glycerol phosphate synthase [Coemansia nantahalensis]KAJ2774403.1 anthranilate synthase / indole-3-glycerol phosphate synthase [Coemansia nantahalensis]KAJ2794813.1 anthranilate synthase / indole-3-glycerol phosphate synthase [Coemansia helicoidea]